MALTVQDVFTETLRKIGVAEMEEPPSPWQLNRCMTNANLMLDSWSAHKLMLRSTVTEGFALTANKASYTIGAGKDFNTSKPITIEDAFIRDSANEDYPVGIATQEEWDSYGDKAVGSGRPYRLFYDPGQSQQATQYGTINLYETPDTGPYTLYIVSWKYLSEFVNLTDTVTFEPAYFEALVYNLAVRVWPDFYPQKDPPKLIVAMAKTSRKTVEMMNHRIVTAFVDVPTAKGGSPYDVFSDSWK